jgi:hypothetical protein
MGRPAIRASIPTGKEIAELCEMGWFDLQQPPEIALGGKTRVKQQWPTSEFTKYKKQSEKKRYCTAIMATPGFQPRSGYSYYLRIHIAVRITEQ